MEDIEEEYWKIRDELYDLGYICLDTFDEERGWLKLEDGSKFYVVNSFKPKFELTESKMKKSILGKCSIEGILKYYNERKKENYQLKLFDEKDLFSSEELEAAILLKIELLQYN